MKEQGEVEGWGGGCPPTMVGFKRPLVLMHVSRTSARVTHSKQNKLGGDLSSPYTYGPRLQRILRLLV